MSDVTLHRDLSAAGYTSRDLDRFIRAGGLHRVRRGAYAAPADLDPHEQHRRLIAATLGQSHPDSVVSHMSAAVLHGLPTWSTELNRVHITRGIPGGGRTRGAVRLHGLPISAEEIVEVDGVLITTLARTVVDLACQMHLEYGVAVGDAALRARLDPRELDEVLTHARRRHGIAAARRAVALLDARSESPEESRSRVVLHLHGIPKPELQYEVHDEYGRLVARCDFGWEEFRTVGEFDGRVKYGRLLRPGQNLEDVLFEEKRREDAVRDQDYQMVRWVSDDLRTPAELIRRLHRAFARSRARRS